ncbi:MAG: sigma-54-dependent transcriptional regulator, partial [Candidatus Sumerlaeota bacterium]
MAQLLLIEDDRAFSKRLAANLQSAGYAIDIADDGSSALEYLKTAFYDLVVTDIRLPDIDGIDILSRIKQGRDGLDPTMPVIVLSSVRDIDTAVRAMREGAADYLTKEAEKQEILMRIERILEQSALINENRYLRDQLDKRSEFQQMVGESPAMMAIKEEIAHLAGQDIPVLIFGETGVGKELIARALHRTGAHPDGPFIDVNCGALPDENMLLSELFGHEKGAFTGATSTRRGKFELARGGTLFLDEIGEMPLESQARILKTIEGLEVTRLGGSRPTKIECRLIFATNKNLEEEVEKGTFRQDLYYRVSMLPIKVPPLRKRQSDIPVLAAFFMDQFCRQYGKPMMTINDEALSVLKTYGWPGNVRELRNIIERLVIRSRSQTIDADALARCGVSLKPSTEETIVLPPEGISIEEVEKKLVIQALEYCDWNQKNAAQMLHMSVDRMNARVKKYGLTHPSWR